MSSDTPDSTNHRPGRRKRWAIGCLTVFLLLVGIGLISLWVGRNLWQSSPVYWEQNTAFVEQTPADTLEVMADNAYNRVFSELSQSRGYVAGGTEKWRPISEDTLGVRTIRLSFVEANAWLAGRLDDWLVNQGRDLPAGLTGPMLAPDDGRLIAAFHYNKDEIDQVFSVAMSLKFLEDGQATLSVDGIWGGRLALPVGQVIDLLPGANGDEDSNVVSVLMGRQAFDPVMPIDGARRARIIGLEVDDTGVGLVVQAEPNKRD